MLAPTPEIHWNIYLNSDNTNKISLSKLSSFLIGAAASVTLGGSALAQTAFEYTSAVFSFADEGPYPGGQTYTSVGNTDATGGGNVGTWSLTLPEGVEMGFTSTTLTITNNSLDNAAVDLVWEASAPGVFEMDNPASLIWSMSNILGPTNLVRYQSPFGEDTGFVSVPNGIGINGITSGSARFGAFDAGDQFRTTVTLAPAQNVHLAMEVRVTQIPEPSAALLGLTAATGLFIRRRRALK